ncbi:MAG: EamA family transporter [Chloroherpetonaceae bacterium]|nr:EamA family transporter [Chloroherpetonaceae bacterium]
MNAFTVSSLPKIDSNLEYKDSLDSSAINPQRSHQEEKAFQLKLILSFAAVYIIWGSTYLAIHYAVETIPPLLQSSFRFICGGIILFIWATIQRAPMPSLNEWLGAGGIGFLLLFCGNGSVSIAEKTVPSGLVALIVSISPVWVVAIDWFKTKSVPKIVTFLGLFLGCLGIYLLCQPLLSVSQANFKTQGIAIMLLIFATLTWSLGSVYSKSITQPKNPAMSSAAQMLCAGVLLFVFAFVKGDWASFKASEVTLQSWLGLSYLIVFGSLIAYTAYTWLVKNAKPSHVVTYAYVNPIVAVFLGWLIAGEGVTPQTVIAGTCCVASVVLMSLDKNK